MRAAFTCLVVAIVLMVWISVETESPTVFALTLVANMLIGWAAGNLAAELSNREDGR